jgi:predicted glutamine amidotransferase
MCRFLVYWGDKTIPVSDWILQTENCLLNQSICDISNRPNADGWGFAYRVGDEFIMEKSPQPAFKDENYKNKAAQITTDLLFAHVRRKSQGMISLQNTHPFIHQKWVFMHNGNIPNFEFYKEKLRLKFLQESDIDTLGTTDSEFLFRYFIHWFEKSENCDVQCILNLISTIIVELIDITKDNMDGELALNFMLTNGEFLLGFRKNRTLHYAKLDDGVLITSEAIDNNLSWTEVPENHFIVATSPSEVKVCAYDVYADSENFQQFKFKI